MAEGLRSPTALKEAALREVAVVMNSKLQGLSESILKLDEKLDRKFTEMIAAIRLLTSNRVVGASSSGDRSPLLHPHGLQTSISGNPQPPFMCPDNSRLRPPSIPLNTSAAITRLSRLDFPTDNGSLVNVLNETASVKRVNYEVPITDECSDDELLCGGTVDVCLFEEKSEQQSGGTVADKCLSEILDDFVAIEVLQPPLHVRDLMIHDARMDDVVSDGVVAETLSSNNFCIQGVRQNAYETLSSLLPPAKPPDEFINVLNVLQCKMSDESRGFTSDWNSYKVSQHVIHKDIETILSDFEDIFHEPIRLQPSRGDHSLTAAKQHYTWVRTQLRRKGKVVVGSDTDFKLHILRWLQCNLMMFFSMEEFADESDSWCYLENFVEDWLGTPPHVPRDLVILGAFSRDASIITIAARFAKLLDAFGMLHECVGRLIIYMNAKMCSAISCLQGVCLNAHEKWVFDFLRAKPPDMNMNGVTILNWNTTVQYDICFGECYWRTHHGLVLSSIQPDRLHFLYRDSLNEDDELLASTSTSTSLCDTLAAKLLAEADKYEVGRLRLMCESLLCKDISVNSVAKILALADHCHALELKAMYLKFATENLVAMMRSDGFEYLKEKCSLLQSELLKTIVGWCSEEPPWPPDFPKHHVLDCTTILKHLTINTTSSTRFRLKSSSSIYCERIKGWTNKQYKVPDDFMNIALPIDVTDCRVNWYIVGARNSTWPAKDFDYENNKQSTVQI